MAEVKRQKSSEPRINKKTPRELGYYFPAEFEPQDAIWLSWPHNVHSWPDGKNGDRELKKMLPEYCRFVASIAAHQRVNINVANERMRAKALNLLFEHNANLPNITFYFHATNDAWCRDHGPAFLVNRTTSKKAVVDWGFNAWGGKYPYDLDDQIPGKIASALHLEVFKPGIIMEGGSVEFNGQGTLITTCECLLNENRNPGLNRDQVEQYLADYYGVTNIIWLNRGIGGDDTNGHIDDLTRFVNPTTVITMVGDGKDSDDARILDENLNLLTSATLESGKPLTIVPITLPDRIDYRGQQVPASYANFLITNRKVIVPTFRQDAKDRAALDTLAKLFPDRSVVGLDSTHIIWGLGSFHCLSQQEPAV